MSAVVLFCRTEQILFFMRYDQVCGDGDHEQLRPRRKEEHEPPRRHCRPPDFDGEGETDLSCESCGVAMYALWTMMRRICWTDL